MDNATVNTPDYSVLNSETGSVLIVQTVEAGDEMKKDYGKAGWHLLPYDALKGIVKVLDFGAKKYSARGWEAGMDYSRVFAALQRHLTSWWNKEGTDSDTGYSHLWHAGCCILFLIAYELRGTGKDDRPS